MVVSQVFRGADYDSGDNLGRRGRLYWILGLRKTANFEGTLLQHQSCMSVLHSLYKGEKFLKENAADLSGINFLCDSVL